MKVCIIGCGAIGSLFGAHLARLSDVEVWAYDPNQAHVDAINKNGLCLTGLADFVVPVRARSNAREIPECDFGIIAAKTLHTRPAIEATAHIFRNGAVCSVQNGVGNEEILAEYVPRVIMGTTFPAGHIVAPGVVNQDTGGKTWIGPFGPKPASMAEVEQLADAINRGGMICLPMEDARGALWTKLIFNSASNAMGALTRLPHGIACEQVWPVMFGLAQEGIAVAKALGVTLDGDPVALLEYGKQVAYKHKPSMLQDVLAQRATEVDALNGGIARIGKEIGVPTPLNDAMAVMIKGLEFSWTLKD
ncbi:ketopantoate reductase family protein [Denitratisoma oestradiolicum]|uniref:2-dehydropantoate 2-reductase n=1 Tax=Denitratisoma oestradiolicum TaxID=311182 RepID=A0A6S6XZN1_9PROT|nr:2-dehydropantoate 2-reductase [Denitratisoma oestradiolicum]CAB1368379.1 2-dehydropantoate 2-reductase [Denitratisoma oestradiolicum]